MCEFTIRKMSKCINCGLDFTDAKQIHKNKLYEGKFMEDFYLIPTTYIGVLTN